MLRLPAFLSRVAAEYDTLNHVPQSPAVRVAYDALCEALDSQFTTLCGLVSVRFTSVDPYPTSAAMFADIDRGQLQVFTGSDLPATHPLSRVAGIYREGYHAGDSCNARCNHSATAITYNLIFRAVHDGLAHYPERNTFGYRGEFAAFKAHARMLAGNVPAIHALATETLGQNAWYNFSRRNLGNFRKVFAPQYAALLPWATVRQALTEVSA